MLHDIVANFRRHARILWALIMRELSTRYGRDNIGFLWLLGEPLIFTFGVLIMWNVIRPAYEHGIRISAFVVTGYMPLILVRHLISHGVNSVRANVPLLYHRQITVLHLYVARLSLEVISVTLSFAVAVGVLMILGLMEAPADLPLIYIGWFVLGWIAFGIALILGAIAEVFEYVERFVQLFTYILVPLSGTFYMVAWLPPQYRSTVLKIPFIHCIEMIRAGFFGPFTPTFYTFSYPIAWAAALTLAGLFLLRFVRDRIDVE
ncbi:MAG TPA: ABC transporter [Caulobacteraceae bacterium]|jgi:capsular polysaccharide transport system permease protein|nr:ABC transporter [Caulobacteraceae bacterium]